MRVKWFWCYMSKILKANIPGNVKNSYFHYLGMTEADITGFVQVSVSIFSRWLCHHQIENANVFNDYIHNDVHIYFIFLTMLLFCWIWFSDDVASVHRGRSLSCVCRRFPKVSLKHQHASGDEEPYTGNKGGVKDCEDDDGEKWIRNIFFSLSGLLVPMEGVWSLPGFPTGSHLSSHNHQDHMISIIIKILIIKHLKGYSVWVGG